MAVDGPLKISAHGQRARIVVEWGDELHEITLTARNWRLVKAGKPLIIRGAGYRYEGEHFRDWWHFAGGLDGGLEVGYARGDDYGQGWLGNLNDARIETFVGDLEGASPPS